MRRFVHLVLLLLVFCTGLVAGSWFSIEKRADAFSAGVDQRLAEQQSVNATPAPISPPKRTYDSEEDMLTAIMSAVSEDDSLLRAHRLHDLLGNLGSAELAVLF